MVQPTQPTKDIAGTRNEIHGRCHCGEITFDAEVDPGAVNTRHCTDCQTPSGSAFRVNIPAPAEHFVLLSGTPETYAKTAESCNKRLHAFCGTCAAPIYACAVDNPQSYGSRQDDHAARPVLATTAKLAALGIALGGLARSRAGVRKRGHVTISRAGFVARAAPVPSLDTAVSAGSRRS